MDEISYNNHKNTSNSKYLTIFKGEIGDCWFMSSLSTLAQKSKGESALKLKEKFIRYVIQPEANCSVKAKKSGLYRFKFFRLGKNIDTF